MKKVLSCCLGLAMMSSVTFANEIGIIFNGEVLHTDVAPIMMENRVMVPVRTILEKAGAIVDFDYDTNKVEINNDINSVEFIIGSNVALVNGEIKKLDVPATEINGRTLIPIRFVSESLGLSVDWQNETVIITNYDETFGNALEEENKDMLFQDEPYGVLEEDMEEPEYLERQEPGTSVAGGTDEIEVNDSITPNEMVNVIAETFENELSNYLNVPEEQQIQDTVDIVELFNNDQSAFEGDIVATLSSSEGGFSYSTTVWAKCDEETLTECVTELKANNEQSKTFMNSVAAIMQYSGAEVVFGDSKVTISSDSNLEAFEYKGMSKSEVVQKLTEDGYTILNR